MNFPSLARFPLVPRSGSLAALALLSFSAPAAAAPQDLYITDCSLGCTSGAGGNQVFCTLVNIHENELIEIGFSLPVDPASLSSSSFRITGTQNGTSPSGSLSVSVLDPRRVIFEPDVVGLGPLSYSFELDSSYSIVLPGTAQGDSGPFITSTTGEPNQSRLVCTVTASEGLLPLVRSECVTSPNSVGPGAFMSTAGSSSLVLNDLVLETGGLPAGTFGVYVIGGEQAFTPLGSGSLCLGGSLGRLGVTLSTGGGTANLPLDVSAIGGAVSIAAGETWRFQHIYRDTDPAGPTFNASDAIRATFF